MSVSEQVTLYMGAAVKASGAAALSPGADRDTDTAVALGGWLLRVVYAAQTATGELPATVAALVSNPDDSRLLDALDTEVHDALLHDPQLSALVSEALVRYLEQEIAAGNSAAAVEMGDLLRGQGDPAGARAAYQRAIDSGNKHAMIDMADLLRGDLGDADGARAWLQRAIVFGDNELALEATVDLGQLLMAFQRDAEGARAAFEHAISSRHPEWAAAAMVSLAALLDRQGDTDGAQAAYQQAIGFGNDDWATQASLGLDAMLRRKDHDVHCPGT